MALSDVLGDQNFVFTAVSLREFRSYDGTYINLAKRLHYGLSAFDTTRFFFASPYALQQGFFREGAFATQRYTGASVIAQYPIATVKGAKNSVVAKAWVAFILGADGQAILSKYGFGKPPG